MFRMRAGDFNVIHHKGGISPSWPITYADFEPYYTRAEELFHVHGDLGTPPAVPGGFGSSFDPTLSVLYSHSVLFFRGGHSF